MRRPMRGWWWRYTALILIVLAALFIGVGLPVRLLVGGAYGLVAGHGHEVRDAVAVVIGLALLAVAREWARRHPV
jgi:hypothetical protein